MRAEEEGIGERLQELAARSHRQMSAVRMERAGVKMGKCTECGDPYPMAQLKTPGHWKSKSRICPLCLRKRNKNGVGR